MAKRILFITSTRVGDAVLSTGLLDHLIETVPGARITVACGPAAAPLFTAVPNLERVIILDKMIFSLHWLRLWGLCGHTLWDTIVDLRNTPISYLFPNIKARRMGRSRDPVHRIFHLAKVLGLENNPPSPKLWFDEANHQTAAHLIPDGTPVLAVGPTANWSAKMWRVEYFAELIERLTAPGGILPGGRVAIFGRDDERPMALRLIDSIPVERRIDLVGHVDILTACACLARCGFYVGNDSGLMHLAAATGIPTLGLFGPSPDVHYAPWGQRCAVARTSIPYEEIFPENFDHRGAATLMDSLTVDAAFDKACRLWESAKGDEV